MVDGLPKSKVCSTCEVEKPLSEYSPRKGRPLGVHYSCKPCLAERAKRQRANKPYSEEYKEKARVRAALWRKENPERNKEIKANWSVRNRSKKTLASFRYKMRRLKRTPSWLSEAHTAQMEEFYWLASDLKAITGEDYHVDHIIPLNGSNVSGLHVPWNLQILPSDINLSKGNRYAG